jgi:hypothetical protein
MTDDQRIIEAAWLARFGFHLVYDPEDAADEPKDFPDEGEVWRLGKSDSYFTRAEAIAWMDERIGR